MGRNKTKLYFYYKELEGNEIQLSWKILYRPLGKKKT